MSMIFSNKKMLKRRIERDVLMCSSLDLQAVFDESLFQSIDALRHYDTGPRLEALRSSLKKELASQTAGPLFDLVFEEIDKALAEMGVPADNELLVFWTAYKDCLKHALDDGLASGWAGGPNNKWTWNELKKERTKFLKDMKGTPAEKFVRHSIHIISQKGQTGGAELSSRIENDALFMHMRNISKSIVSVARSSISDILTAKIRNMVEDSPANVAAQRRRSKIR